ncbi:MAG: hypothetical protein AAF389_09410 [Gemmatimonadota bacterium]
MEIRRDVGACDQGRLRGGVLITLATVLVVASGWPPGDGVQRGIFLVMGALPMLALGAGLSVGEIINARTDRRGQDDADHREFELLRARIARDRGRAPAEPSVDEVRAAADARRRGPRPLMENLGPLVTRKRSAASFRSGYLRLR